MARDAPTWTFNSRNWRDRSDTVRIVSIGTKFVAEYTHPDSRALGVADARLMGGGDGLLRWSKQAGAEQLS